MYAATHNDKIASVLAAYQIDMNLNLDEVRFITKRSQSTLYDMMQKGHFPKSLKLFGSRERVWKASIIAHWMEKTNNGETPQLWIESEESK